MGPRVPLRCERPQTAGLPLGGLISPHHVLRSPSPNCVLRAGCPLPPGTALQGAFTMSAEKAVQPRCKGTAAPGQPLGTLRTHARAQGSATLTGKGRLGLVSARAGHTARRVCDVNGL